MTALKIAAPALPRLLAPEVFVARLQDDNLRIVDLSQQRVYDEAHVPGAVHLDCKRTQTGTLPAPGALPPADALSELLSSLGIGPDTHVVAYDDEGGGWAGRFLWLLEMIGHTQWSYLDGGIHAWMAAKLPIEQRNNTPVRSAFIARVTGAAAVDKEYIRAHIHAPGFAIWDARSRDEFDGVRALAARGGHIPGAVNLDWVDCMDRTHHMRLRDLAQLRATLADLGITADQDIVTHCQTHHRSGLSWLVGTLLGFPHIRAYAGSWSEWGNDPTLPVEVTH